MKSMDIDSQGWREIGNCLSSPYGLWYFDLFCIQVLQVLIYSLTKAHILGQLYSCQMSWYVLDCPMYPTGWWSCFAFNTCNQRSLFSGTKTCLSCSKTLLFLIDYWELSISLPNPSYSGRVRSAASTTLMFVSKELVSTVVIACNAGYGWGIIWELFSRCSFENIGQRFVALDNLSLLYTFHQ